MKKPYFTAFYLVVFSLFFSVKGYSQTETIQTGSFIINMGNTNTASINDDVRPYGLIYDLIKNLQVPIKWVINQSKAKDGADFTHNGITYSGGTFIIPAANRTAAVNAKIASWQALGVVGATSVSDFTAYVYKTMTSVPKWTLDAANGGIAQGYLTAAGITLTAFPGAYNFKAVSALDCCDDFFVMPHADPTWATHSRLFSWNKDCLGSIWAACHAVSALENSINPSDATQQMNFLSTRTSYTPTGVTWPNNSLKLWGTHSGGSIPYTFNPAMATDPVAQYMGVTDLSQLNGSEQIYIPKQSTDPAPAGGPTRWRPETNIIAFDPTQINVPSPDLANGNVAAVVIYGRGLGDPTRGYVMYEAGHSHMKGTTSDGPALRAFLNFSFFQVQPKAPILTPLTGLTTGQLIAQGSTVTGLSVSATSILTGITFSYLWVAKDGNGNVVGTFSAPTLSTTNYTAPATVSSNTPITISCIVSDQCGRASFSSQDVVITPCIYTITPTVTTPGCFGSSSGSISMVITGGAGPYNWSWTRTNPAGGPATGTGTNITGLAAGTYAITVTNGAGCSGSVTVLVTQPAALAASAVATPAPCNGAATGAVNLTVSGGTTPYTYNWNSGAYTTEDLLNVPAGVYNVTVTDSKGCTTTASATVTQPAAALSISASTVTNVSCNGGTNGAIDITVAGGTSPYTYDWGGGVTTEDRTSLPAGTYNVKVTDANSCILNASYTVTQPAALQLSAVVTQPSCPPGAQQNAGNGAIDLTVAGGTAPFTYAWTASGTGVVPGGQAGNQDLTGLVTGTYSVTVTDSKGCVKTYTTTLTNIYPNPSQPSGINQ